ncbi:MAG: bacillithiol biosynthesis protein BshC, partial [Candidatus Heimdallarchaeaceae archaeon]
AGQQATIFGGSGIIGNKIATAVKISDISKDKEKPLVPVFLVNTHDGIQSEITTIHLMNNQSSNSKAIHLSDLIEGVAAHTIRTDNYKWLNENLDIIRNIFSEFKTSLDKTEFKLFSEKVEHLLTFLRETYRASKTIEDWAALIWGIQSNIINDWGVIYVPSCHSEIKRMTAESYTPFLRNRSEYIDEFNQATNKIVGLNLRPTTAKKESDYSPFFYECPNDGFRVTLSCSEDGDDIVLHGRCPLDKIEYNIKVNKNDIDLLDYATNLSPRLDTNQAQLQTILPTYIRVSGPGEINYNAQVIPAVRKIGINYPLYVKYNRIHYNTPWIEKISNDSALESHTLFSSEFFKTLGVFAKAKRKGEKEELHDVSKILTEKIISRISQLKSISEEPTNPISKYKSWQFGMYDENHQWQEVSWPWFVMSSISGIGDYLASYYRYYSKDSLVGGVGYINTRL